MQAPIAKRTPNEPTPSAPPSWNDSRSVWSENSISAKKTVFSAATPLPFRRVKGCGVAAEKTVFFAEMLFSDHTDRLSFHEGGADGVGSFGVRLAIGACIQPHLLRPIGEGRIAPGGDDVTVPVRHDHHVR